MYVKKGYAKVEYNGVVEQGRHADIVIGPIEQEESNEK